MMFTFLTNDLNKKSISISLLLFVGIGCHPVEDSKVEDLKLKTDEIETIDEIKAKYDSVKAEEYGADKYGMKAYVIAFLKRGPTPPKDSTQSAELQRSHMDNINRLAKEGKLVMAGPFFGNDSLRGLYIFNTSDIEEARQWTSSDPAIQYGNLKMVLKKWYGSAALMEMNKIHSTIAKIEI
jgi:uncharacterized protein YciI